MELATMQDMDTDLLNFDAFFSPNNDEGVEGKEYNTRLPNLVQNIILKRVYNYRFVEPRSDYCCRP